MKRRDRELGMDRSISRRDFISGVGVAVSGSLLYPWAETQGAPRIQFAPERQAGYYPPARTGMRGSHEGSYEVAHELVEGKTWDDAADTGESYDLVVVGGGISGLATAYYFQQQVGPKARILILDNHDDFGGHAKRNEFHHDGRLLLMNGGTIYIEDFAYYDDAGQRLLRELGLEVERNSEFENPDVYRSRKLSHGVFFDKETFGADHLAVGKGELPWTATGIRYATLSTEPVAVVVSEGDQILYSVFSKPFASRLDLGSDRIGRPWYVPVKSVTRRLNVGGKVLSEERDVVPASQWFTMAEGELVEEVLGLGSYGKTLTVLTYEGPCDYLDRTLRGE